MAGGLFDIFDSSGGTQAATQAYNAVNSGLKQGRSDITGNNASAIDTLNSATERGLNYLQGANNAAVGSLQSTTPTWQALSNIGNKGISNYGNFVSGLLGLNGANPQTALENLPGYQFTLNQGIQSLDRTANAAGNPYNATDVMNYASGLANQNYLNYLNAGTAALNPYFGLAQNAATGLSGNAADIANAYNQLGSNESNVVTGAGGQTAGIQSGQGTQLAALDTAQGQNAAELAQNKYAADQGASQNIWNAILGLTGGLTSAAGKAGGFGTLFS